MFFCAPLVHHKGTFINDVIIFGAFLDPPLVIKNHHLAYPPPPPPYDDVINE
jgi:hypothetical protein